METIHITVLPMIFFSQLGKVHPLERVSDTCIPGTYNIVDTVCTRTAKFC